MLFGGMYGKNNGAGYRNPFTNSLSCPVGYASAQILGTGGTDYNMFFCYRKASENDLLPRPVKYYAFGGVYSSEYNNPITNRKNCPGGYRSRQVLGTNNVDYPFYFCYKELDDTLPDLDNSYDFGGFVGYVSGSVSNVATGGFSCPVGFTMNKVLGHSGTDYPVSVCTP